jgi:sigma-E factor negative regulatory protein RseC
MLETQGRVIAVEAGFAWVESVRQGGCSSCASKGACGSQLLGEALAPAANNQASNNVLARDSLGVRVGDSVILGVEEEGALGAAFLMYGLPLFGLMLGLLLAQPWGDLWALAAGGAGLGLALAVVRLLGRVSQHKSQNVQPIILARLDSVTSKVIPIQKA